MRKRLIWPAVFVAALVALGVVAYRVGHRGDDLAEAALAKGAPAAGSCWSVDEKAALDAMPWKGAVDCSAGHTAEVFHVGRVDKALVRDAARADGDEKRVREGLMYAQARRTCTVEASRYLGGGWHAMKVRVLASWVRPARTGYFGCALVETRDPAGQRFVSRTGTLRGAPADLAIACVTDDGGLVYAGCDTPHSGEYAGTYTVTPLDAPFEEKGVRTAVSKGCAETVAKYVGSSARTDLRAAYVGPASATDWLGSDQTFACYAMAVDGRLRGSLKGLAGKALPRP